MTWLARRYSPEKVIDWTARREGSRAYYASHFRQVFGVSMEEAWAQWIADERTFQLANLAAIRKYPITPHRDVTEPRARLGVARLRRSGGEEDLRGLQLSRRRRAHRRHRYRERRRAAHPADQGTGDLQRHVAGVGSRRARAVLHDRQRLVSRPGAARPGHGPDARAPERRAHRRHRLQQERQGPLGDPAPEWLRHHRPHSGAVHGVGADQDAALRHDRLRPRRLAGRHQAGGVVRRDYRRAGRARAEHRGLEKGRRDAAGEVRLLAVGAERLHLLGRRPVSLRQLVSDRRLQHLSV